MIFKIFFFEYDYMKIKKKFFLYIYMRFIVNFEYNGIFNNI